MTRPAAEQQQQAAAAAATDNNTAILDKTDDSNATANSTAQADQPLVGLTSQRYLSIFRHTIVPVSFSIRKSKQYKRAQQTQNPRFFQFAASDIHHNSLEEGMFPKISNPVEVARISFTLIGPILS